MVADYLWVFHIIFVNIKIFLQPLENWKQPIQKDMSGQISPIGQSMSADPW